MGYAPEYDFLPSMLLSKSPIECAWVVVLHNVSFVLLKSLHCGHCDIEVQKSALEGWTDLCPSWHNEVIGQRDRWWWCSHSRHHLVCVLKCESVPCLQSTMLELGLGLPTFRDGTFCKATANCKAGLHSGQGPSHVMHVCCM